MDDKGCLKTPSLRVQTAPELEDAGTVYLNNQYTHAKESIKSYLSTSLCRW